MKKYSAFMTGILSLLLVFGLTLTGCPMDGGGGGDDKSTDPVTVTEFNLTGKVTAPVRDATPVTTAIDGTQYTGTIAWQTTDGTAVSGNFAAGTAYQAVVTLAAKTGFTFTGVAKDAFTYSNATATNAADSGTVTISFPATAAAGAATVVNILDLTGKVTAPVKDATPATTFSKTPQYTGAIVWKKADDTAVSGKFAAGTVYKAVVTLAAETGFTFTGVPKDAFTHDDATKVANAASSGTVTITFPAVTAAAPTPPGGGKGITFTGIDSKYNGQYAAFRSSGGTPPTGGDYLIGSTSSTELKGARISGGSVTVPVYLVESQTSKNLVPYTGNNSGIRIYLYIKGIPSFTQDEVFGSGLTEAYTIDPVNFTNGSASANVGGSGGGTGIDNKWRGTYTSMGGDGDSITVTANSATYKDKDGKDQPSTNGITTETGGNILYSGTDAGDWVYILFSGTRVGVAMTASDGTNTYTMIGIGADGVTDLIDGAKEQKASFSPEPSISGDPTSGFDFVGVKSN
jgi:hypothetical protein